MMIDIQFFMTLNNYYMKGLELAPLMKNQTTGRPRKDPSTG